MKEEALNQGQKQEKEALLTAKASGLSGVGGTQRARRTAADAAKTAMKKYCISPRSLRFAAPAAFP